MLANDLPIREAMLGRLGAGGPSVQGLDLDHVAEVLRTELLAPRREAMLFEVAYSLIRHAMPAEPSLALVSCLFAITRHYYAAAKPENGLLPATQAVESARKINDPATLAKALKIYGVILAE